MPIRRSPNDARHPGPQALHFASEFRNSASLITPRAASHWQSKTFRWQRRGFILVKLRSRPWCLPAVPHNAQRRALRGLPIQVPFTILHTTRETVSLKASGRPTIVQSSHQFAHLWRHKCPLAGSITSSKKHPLPLCTTPCSGTLERLSSPPRLVRSFHIGFWLSRVTLPSTSCVGLKTRRCHSALFPRSRMWQATNLNRSFGSNTAHRA